MSDTHKKETFVRVDRNYLIRGDSPVELKHPYSISTDVYPFNGDNPGRDRLTAQKELQDLGARPPTLFEELNAAAEHFYDSENRIPSPVEIEVIRNAGHNDLWLDHLLVGKDTPAKGTQHGVRYVIDYISMTGGKCYFASDKAKIPIMITGWEYEKKGDGDKWIIVPNKMIEIPEDILEDVLLYDPQDANPDTGFIGKPCSTGHQIAWMNCPQIKGMHPVTINMNGDVSAVWNLDDKEAYIATRKVMRE